ncbi:MAG: hypothetical protein R2761_05875 [Acidimicrobiales bacterium]
MAIEGSISLSTLLVKLLRTEGFPTEGLTAAEQDQQQVVSRWADSIAMHAWPSLADPVPMRNLPAILSEDLKYTLLHERVHYWQALSLPALGMHYLRNLELYRNGAREAKLYSRQIAGPLLGMPPVSARSLRQNDSISKANFGHKPFRSTDVKAYNTVPGEPDVGLLFTIDDDLKTGSPLDFGHPGYAVMLQPTPTDLFFGNQVGGPSKYNLSGLSLIESGAFVSEHLARSGVPPPSKFILTEEDEIYHGPWEFFRRALRRRFSSEIDLAFGFLAAVDLALLIAPSPGPGDWSIEDRALNVSSSYRFGKIVFGLSGFEHRELPASGAGLDEIIERFEDDFCKWFGLDPPRLCLARMTCILTTCLAQAVADRDDQLLSELYPWLVRRFTAEEEIVREILEDPDVLRPIWLMIGKSRAARPPLFGQDVLGAMLNATVFRMRHRAAFAAPHISSASLRPLFPIPLIVLDGTYCWDAEIDDLELVVGDPYPITSRDLVHDVISLIVLDPLRDGSTDCGFNRLHQRCAYQVHGLGCPKLGVTDSEDRLREEKGIKDWCHWKLRSLLLSPRTGSGE